MKVNSAIGLSSLIRSDEPKPAASDSSNFLSREPDNNSGDALIIATFLPSIFPSTPLPISVSEDTFNGDKPSSSQLLMIISAYG